MTARYPITAFQRQPLAACLALALALPMASSVIPGHAASIHRSAVPGSATLPITTCADDGSPGSLRAVVAGAASGDTIDLTQLTCGTITLASGQINIPQDDLTLSGPGVAILTIDAGNASRAVAHTGAGTLTLDALRVTGGHAASMPGGCIYSAANVNLDHSTVTGCSADPTSGASKGGGLYAKGDASLVSSIISSSSAYNGGGLEALGNVILSDSAIASNSAYDNGGGIFAGKNLAMDSSTVDGNNAYIGGGVSAYGSAITITGSTVSNNHAVFNGGGLIDYPRPFTSNNIAMITNSTFSGNVSDGYTGGVILNMELILSNSTISFNQAAYPDAGLSVLNAYRASYEEDVQINSSIIASNSITSSGASADIFTYGYTVVTGANNLIGSSSVALPPDTISADPGLLPLAANGGPTRTHALLPGSPAIDAGNNLLGLMDDQRGDGFARVSGASADIGAFESQQTAAAPTVSERFLPDSMLVDGITTLTITLGNGGAAAATLTAPLTDGLPSSLAVAGVPNASTTCAGGTVTAAVGSSAIVLGAGTQIPVAGNCTVTVSVTAHAAGGFTNVIAAGALQTDAGNNPDSASADLTVSGEPGAPVVTKAFSPGIVGAGGTSTLTITLANSNANTATLSAALTDNLPPPMVVADPSNAATNCPNGTVSASAGSGVVALQAGGQIPAGTCTVTVAVVANMAGSYINTIPAGALQTDEGSNPDSASAGLTVKAPGAPPSVAKAFAPNAISAGGSSLLTITLSNVNSNDATLTAALTDHLPASLVVANPANASTTCPAGIETANPGATWVALGTGARIPAGSSCAVTVAVTGNTSGSFTNVIPAGDLQTDAGSSPEDATAQLAVAASTHETIFADGFDPPSS